MKDLKGKGSIFEPEMVKYNKKDNAYKVEKIIRKKRDKYLVKCLGYLEEFYSWINKEELRQDNYPAC